VLFLGLAPLGRTQAAALSVSDHLADIEKGNSVHREGAPRRGAALPGKSSERAEAPITAAAIAFELRYGTSPAPAPVRDRWLGRDKVQHVVFSGLWTLSTQYILVNKADWTERDALPASIASGAAIGILKELYDASRLTGTASGKDLVANAVGIGLAVAVIRL
jgi:uncharacterized protein YfiM (DUF2279 family)